MSLTKKIIAQSKHDLSFSKNEMKNCRSGKSVISDQKGFIQKHIIYLVSRINIYDLLRKPIKK